jgi:uncharacterized protein YbaP (TraB family)
MNRTLTILLLTLLGTSLSAPAAPGEGRAIIWEFKGHSHSVFIAGSVHLLREKDFPIPPNYNEIYEKADELIFEIDTAVLNDPATALSMKQLSNFQNGDTVEDHISPETFELLQKFLKKRELPTSQLLQMKPGMLALTLSSIEAMRNGARPDLGLEMRYGALAARDKKPTSGLETIEYQIGMFDDLTGEEADEMLRSTLENLEDISESLDDLIDAWRAGDAEVMDKLVNAEFDENEKLRNVLLVDRNRNWIPHIEKAIAGDRNVLVMVGAGHLVGKDSVIEMLKAKGHKLEQLTYDPDAENAPKLKKRDKKKNKKGKKNQPAEPAEEKKAA